MNKENLYSIRMHASADGRHLSGAERIVPHEKIEVVVGELLARAEGKTHSPEKIVLHIESLGDMPPLCLTALDLVTMNASDVIIGRSTASRILQIIGVSSQAVETALECLSKGAALSGGVMRGAMIMDAKNGERLEPDHERGVRASRFDWSEEASDKIDKSLVAVGLTHYRTREALALATKVANGPGIVAELCWSDDPDYTAGYVASRSMGYVRFPFLKQSGDTSGGRVFFVDGNKLDMDALIWYLQTQAVLINDIGVCRPVIKAEEYFREGMSFPKR
jgi:6-carboxyhexanoate--CoA ligase